MFKEFGTLSKLLEQGSCIKCQTVITIYLRVGAFYKCECHFEFTLEYKGRQFHCANITLIMWRKISKKINHWKGIRVRGTQKVVLFPTGGSKKF